MQWRPLGPLYPVMFFDANAIESLNSTLRTAIRSRGHFGGDQAVVPRLARGQPEMEECAARVDCPMTQFAIMFGESSAFIRGMQVKPTPHTRFLTGSPPRNGPAPSFAARYTPSE